MSSTEDSEINLIYVNEKADACQSDLAESYDVDGVKISKNFAEFSHSTGDDSGISSSYVNLSDKSKKIRKPRKEPNSSAKKRLSIEKTNVSILTRGFARYFIEKLSNNPSSRLENFFKHPKNSHLANYEVPLKNYISTYFYGKDKMKIKIGNLKRLKFLCFPHKKDTQELLKVKEILLKLFKIFFSIKHYYNWIDNVSKSKDENKTWLKKQREVLSKKFLHNVKKSSYKKDNSESMIDYSNEIDLDIEVNLEGVDLDS